MSIVGKYFLSKLEINAELRFFFAGHYIFMCLVFDIGVDSQGGFWHFSGFEFFCQPDDGFSLLFGFNVEVCDAGLETFDDFGIGLAYAREDGFGRVAAGLENAKAPAAPAAPLINDLLGSCMFFLSFFRDVYFGPGGSFSFKKFVKAV